MRGATLLPRWLRVAAVVGVALLALPILGLLTAVDRAALVPTLTSPSALIALRLSLVTALAATALSLLVGLPVALLMARSDPGSVLLRIVRTLVLLPLVLPPVVGGIALLSTYGRRGLVAPLADVLGIDIAFTTVAVVLAQTFVAAPFLILTVEGALSSRGTAYEATALTLGAGPTRTLATVTLPLLAQGLGAGLVLTFARALGEFGATITFAGSLQGTTRTLPLEIYLAREIDQDSAVAMSLLLMVVAAVVVAFAYRSPGADGFRRSLGARPRPAGGAPAEEGVVPEGTGTGPGVAASHQSTAIAAPHDVGAAPAPATPAPIVTAPAAPSLDAHVDVPERGVDVTVHIPAGQTLAIIGANGSGKSTVLDTLAGLVPSTGGHLHLGGRTLAGPGLRTPLPPHRRGITRLGQVPLLFPHLSLRRNVAFGLRASGTDRATARKQADQWLDRVGLAHLAERRPDQVSGGQAQRAAVARALAARPELSLWDEPFAALDVDAAPRLRELLARHLAGRTAVVVTHDLADVRALADRVLVLDRGRVIQDVTTEEFLRSPSAGFAQRLTAEQRIPGSRQ
ncbi:molybdate transport system permease protein [Brachybacterium muris]|uniref:ABC transporter permease n=1 Tax=Brachybacterium muris TaxID=219301 RepID=UPI0030B8D1F1|nr:molybdate transport system permease protein [Brachybacterium muris]